MGVYSASSVSCPSASSTNSKKWECSTGEKLLSVPKQASQFLDNERSRDCNTTSSRLRSNSDICSTELRKSIITVSQENVQDPVPDLDVHIPIKEVEVGEIGEEDRKGAREEGEIIKSSSSASSSSSTEQDPAIDSEHLH